MSFEEDNTNSQVIGNFFDEGFNEVNISEANFLQSFQVRTFGVNTKLKELEIDIYDDEGLISYEKLRPYLRIVLGEETKKNFERKGIVTEFRSCKRSDFEKRGMDPAYLDNLAV